MNRKNAVTALRLRALQRQGADATNILQTCTTNVADFSFPTTVGACAELEPFTEYSPPFPNADASGSDLENDVTWYDCPTSGLLVMRSNVIPDHKVTTGNPNNPCVQHVHAEYPRTPTYTTNKKVEANYILGFAVNGVAAFNALEGGNTNAVEPSTDSAVSDAQYWYGHAETTGIWHYHSSEMGVESSDDYLDSSVQLGVAMDDFPIYGALDSPDSVLDECNFDAANGRYHIRTTDQVDETLDYCGDDEAVNWNYIIGCYKGDLSSSAIIDASATELPNDCVAMDSSITS